MLQTYLNIINHNRYLKINYNNFNKYSKLESININIRFKNNLNQKFYIIYIFFLFKTLFNQNGYFIMLNKKNRKIVGIKMILKNSNLKTFLEFLIANFLNQLEVQNNITLKSFDLKNNYALNLYSNTFYYFEKSIKNLYFKSVLNYANCVILLEDYIPKDITSFVKTLDLMKVVEEPDKTNFISKRKIANFKSKEMFNYFNIVAIFNFVNNTDLFDHIFYLNFFKFYFNK